MVVRKSMIPIMVACWTERKRSKGYVCSADGTGRRRLESIDLAANCYVNLPKSRDRLFVLRVGRPLQAASGGDRCRQPVGAASEASRLAKQVAKASKLSQTEKVNVTYLFASWA